jgi:predicted metal-dependent phosphoesterase TrpH
VATLKFDFHLHTLDDPCDHHVYHTVFELIDKAATLHYGALAITLHDVQFESRVADEYAAARGILLLSGIERTIEGGHVLLINYPKQVTESIHSFDDLRRAKRPEGLVIAAHPFFPGGPSVGDNLLKHRDVFDAVEISGFYHRLWNPNRKGKDAARRIGLPLVGNSDTHTLEQFGTTWSEIECEPEVASLIQAIKEGRAKVMGRALQASEMGVIAYKVVGRGYMKWINYKRSRGYQPAE